MRSFGVLLAFLFFPNSYTLYEYDTPSMYDIRERVRLDRHYGVLLDNGALAS